MTRTPEELALRILQVGWAHTSDAARPRIAEFIYAHERDLRDELIKRASEVDYDWFRVDFIREFFAERGIKEQDK